MKKNITLLVFLAIGTVVLMASYRNKGQHEQNAATMLTAHAWTFEGAESLNGRAEAVINNLYHKAQYNFTNENTFQGEFFDIPIQGNWTIEGERLVLNKGTVKEEQMEIAQISEQLLKIRIMEKGSSVTMTFR